MKAEIRSKEDESCCCTIPANKMKVGEIGIVDDPMYNGVILLRVYEHIISLSDPGLIWSTDCGLLVRHLKLDEEVVLSI